MNHEQAIQAQASLRYAMGELTPAERDSFEEHFADCAECLRDVEASAAFTANARQVFREGGRPKERPNRLAWLQWRPFPALALSAALNLVLLAGLGYELARLQPGAAVPAEPESVQVVGIHGATRSASDLQVVRTPRRPVVLTFDLPQAYERYRYTIERSGTVIMSGGGAVEGKPDSLNLQIPAARLDPGEYRVTVTGISGAASDLLGACQLRVESK